MSVDSFVKRNCKSANDDERCLRVDHLNALKLFQLFIAQKWRLSRKIDIVRKKRRELSNARVWYESRDEKINVWDRENKWVWVRHWDVRRSESTRALAKKEFEISHSFVLLYRLLAMTLYESRFSLMTFLETSIDDRYRRDCMRSLWRQVCERTLLAIFSFFSFILMRIAQVLWLVIVKKHCM